MVWNRIPTPNVKERVKASNRKPEEKKLKNVRTKRLGNIPNQRVYARSIATTSKL